jgi:hypothetical protein
MIAESPGRIKADRVNGDGKLVTMGSDAASSLLAINQPLYISDRTGLLE